MSEREDASREGAWLSGFPADWRLSRRPLGEGGREGFYSVAALAEQVMQRVSDFQYFSLGKGSRSRDNKLF